VEIICAFCGNTVDKASSAVNRANKNNVNMYCNRKCSGNAHKAHKSTDKKKEEKRIYDAEYRKNNKEKLKKDKVAWFKNNYDPILAAEKRALTMDRHVEYCRQPEYKKKKKAYDRIYQAKKYYGEFYEHHLLILQIFDVIKSHSTMYQIKYDQGCLNKTQNRKREHERFNSEKLERCALGNTK